VEKPHKQLEVWKKSMELAVKIYDVTRSFPESEKYGLVSQMRRSAVSIPSNLAEGAARQGPAEFVRFVHIALGSCSELDTQLDLSHRLGYLSVETWEAVNGKLEEIDRMLIGLRNSLRERQSRKKGVKGKKQAVKDEAFAVTPNSLAPDSSLS